MRKSPSPEAAGLPRLRIVGRQRRVPYSRSRLDEIVRAALPGCLAEARRHGGPLSRLPEIEISVLGPRAMAAVHLEFLNEPGATDVITFPYGEILVCAGIAAERAAEFGHTVTEELALYCIHGLLHLAGLDDLRPADAAVMKRRQERILSDAITRNPPAPAGVGPAGGSRRTNFV